MDGPTPLARVIGETERTMRAVLERLLSKAGLSFPQWTVLVFLHRAEQLTLSQLVDQLGRGQIASGDAAAVAIEQLLADGLIGTTRTSTSGQEHDSDLALTAQGLTTFLPLRDRVARMTGDLFEHLSEADVEATRRTLETIADRAQHVLAAEHDALKPVR